MVEGTEPTEPQINDKRKNVKGARVVNRESRKEYPGGLPEDRLNNVIISKEPTKPTKPKRVEYEGGL